MASFKAIHVLYDKYSKEPVAAFVSRDLAGVVNERIADARMDLTTVPVIDTQAGNVGVVMHDYMPKLSEVEQ